MKGEEQPILDFGEGPNESPDDVIKKQLDLAESARKKMRSGGKEQLNKYEEEITESWAKDDQPTWR